MGLTLFHKPSGDRKTCASGKKARKFIHKFRIVKLSGLFFSLNQSILRFLNIKRTSPNDRIMRTRIIIHDHLDVVSGRSTFMP